MAFHLYIYLLITPVWSLTYGIGSYSVSETDVIIFTDYSSMEFNLRYWELFC